MDFEDHNQWYWVVLAILAIIAIGSLVAGIAAGNASVASLGMPKGFAQDIGYILMHHHALVYALAFGPLAMVALLTWYLIASYRNRWDHHILRLIAVMADLFFIGMAIVTSILVVMFVVAVVALMGIVMLFASQR